MIRKRRTELHREAYGFKPPHRVVATIDVIAGRTEWAPRHSAQPFIPSNTMNRHRATTCANASRRLAFARPLHIHRCGIKRSSTSCLERRYLAPQRSSAYIKHLRRREREHCGHDPQPLTPLLG